MIIVLNTRRSMYCNDGRMRFHYLFGSTPSCVKIYKVLGCAKNRADKIRGGRVIVIPDGMEINGCKVIERVPAGEGPADGSPWPQCGYETIIHHEFEEFLC